MGIVGREIIQTRTYIDPTNPSPPNQNYKESFPVTVFDAVRESMDNPDSTKLSEVIGEIRESLQGKQPLFPAKSANYLMTYAGVPGAVGAIQMSLDIPWDPTEQRHDRIPTEKAVGTLIQKLGLVDGNGNVINPDRSKIIWSDIIGRPLLYSELGDHDDGFITQKGITAIINSMKSSVADMNVDITGRITAIQAAMSAHISDMNNPHGLTADQIGAITEEAFQLHLDAVNPHGITPSIIGLGEVDNTSDINKPISLATQEALDELRELLNELGDDAKGFITELTYDQPSGILQIKYNNGSTLSLVIPIDGLVDEISFDKETKELVIVELGGYEHRINLSDLFIRYIGSISTHITIEIIGTNETGEQIINATINPQSITENELADNSVITRIIKDRAITTAKIEDLAVTTVKLEDGCVVTEKIAPKAITNTRIADRSVDARTLFSSPANFRVLVIGKAGTDPYWGQINTEMIQNAAIKEQLIAKDAITSDKIVDGSIGSTKLSDQAVTTPKIADGAVINNKISNRTITGDKLVENVQIPGLPTITKSPSTDSNNNEVPNTAWVRKQMNNFINQNSNYADRSVDGRVLFSSTIRHRILAVLRANSDPVWTQVDHEMLADDAVGTSNIIDNAVTSTKISDKSIYGKHLNVGTIDTDHLKDGIVTSQKIFSSEQANMVLAALTEKGHPVYTQIKKEMIEHNAISSMHIEDRSVTPSKIQSSNEANRVLGVTLSQTNPVWTQIRTGMIEDHAVTLDKIATAPFQDMILASVVAGTSPVWVKLNERMIEEGAIRREHIGAEEIWGEHIHPKSIDSSHILDWSIKSNNIAPGAITGTELFTSPVPNRILGVTSMPYSKPDWMQLVTDMIEDKAVTGDKLFRSNHPYRVLAATKEGVPPEYTMITHDFIVDGTITPNKLIHNFVLYGTPELVIEPKNDADNRQLANTAWVRRTVTDMMVNFDPKVMYDVVHTDMIEDHAITGKKLFTHPYGPRVLGITAPNEEVEFILIEEDLIADGAVTRNKLERSMHLLGSPQVEVRPSPTARDATGEGHLIPDVQWVLDRIAEASIGNGNSGSSNTKDPNGWTQLSPDEVHDMWNPGILPSDWEDDSNDMTAAIRQINQSETADLWDNRPVDDTGNTPIPMDQITDVETFDMWYTGRLPEETDDDITNGNTVTGDILDGSITTGKLQDRAVTGDKLFTSPIANRVLGVLSANSNPKYVQVIEAMMADRSVSARTMWRPNEDAMILAVKCAGNDPTWTKVTLPMMGQESIGTEQLVNRSVTNDKLATGAITRDKVADVPLVDQILLMTDSVSTEKIVDGAVESDKIADNAVTSEKLDKDLVLKGAPIVEANTNYETRSLRNVIISPNAPSEGNPGDIWFQYV